MCRYLAAAVWGWLPGEWWDLNALILRADRELAALDTEVASISVRVASGTAQHKLLQSQRTEMDDYLEGARQEIFRISKRR
jgi:hypothetical protein